MVEAYCDICGSSIPGQPLVVEVEGAALALCPNCARRYASAKGVKIVGGQPQQGQVRVYRSTGRSGSTTRIVRQPQGRIDRLEVVEDYAQLIRSARESLGMSREALAKVLGVKESIVRRIEDGQLVPDIELARRIERVLGVRLVREAEEAPYEPVKGGRFELTLGDVVTIRRRKKGEEGG